MRNLFSKFSGYLSNNPKRESGFFSISKWWSQRWIYFYLAEDRLDVLEKETKKAQKTSEEYQKLYELERMKVEQYEKQEMDNNANPLQRRSVQI